MKHLFNKVNRTVAKSDFTARTALYWIKYYANMSNILISGSIVGVVSWRMLPVCLFFIVPQFDSREQQKTLGERGGEKGTKVFGWT